jgi:hypothetical protein
MRTRVLAALALAVPTALAAGPAGATKAPPTSPYPPSTLVAGIAWDATSYRSAAPGGDIWPVTSGAGGEVYTAWGDGPMPGCPAKVSYGTAVLTGGAGANPVTLGCGPRGQGRGKIGSLLAVGGTLYAVVNLQDRPWPKSSVALWASTDGGASWLRPAWRFAGKDLRPVELVNLGPGYADAPDAYVYMTAARPVDPAREVFLARAPADALQDRTRYAYFAGMDATGLPVWDDDQGSAVPVFADPAGAGGPALVWDAGLGRYLLTAGHGGGGTLGLFEAPALWGPWSTIDYEARWLGMRGGDYLGVRFPSAWMADGGTTLWAVFSCYGRPACGVYHDRYNLIRATLTLAPPPPAKAGR